jgi:uncharacterized protein (DUF1697 family)
VVFLRGINVGGHRTFRPSMLARQLRAYDVVNVGAAGTFVVRKPGSSVRFKAELARKLPFEAEIVLCQGEDIIRLETQNPFDRTVSHPDVVRFVSVMAKARGAPTIPISLPDERDWLVRLIAADRQFVFGMYRRQMKTIGYLGQIDKLFGGKATTRNWNTIMSVVKILKAGSQPANQD